LRNRLLICIGIGLGIGAGAETTAWADQCAWVPEEQARSAAARVHVGDRVREYCEPCKDKAPSDARTVRSAEVRPVRAEPRFWQLVIDGKGVDFAYLFVESKNEPGRFDNLAKLAGCPAEDVSVSIRGR
jgi:hypothetical protein